MANVTLSADGLGGAERDPNAPCYWKAENHTSDNYLRADRWLPAVEEFMFGGTNLTVPMSFDSGAAILRYREEVKMYAALRDSERKKRGILPSEPAESLHDCDFLDERWEAVLQEWPPSPTRGPWLQALLQLRDAMHDAIASLPSGVAFVKLSVRSPKDAVFDITRSRQLIVERVKASSLPADSPLALSEDVCTLRWASWQAMRATTGDEALQLLLRSDRVYVDLLQHELFASSMDKKQSWDMNVHVSEFFEDFDPNWEFRGFVANGVRTSLTAYSPWVYDAQLAENKAEVLAVIEGVWDQVQPRIESQNYSVDFAVAPDLSRCWIVEVNDFLPPLAGCGLFVYSNDKDREILENGPFTFLVKEQPLQHSDFIQTRVDKKTGKTSRMQMHPAPPHLMRLLADLRREQQGLPPLSSDDNNTSVDGSREAAAGENSSSSAGGDEGSAGAAGGGGGGTSGAAGTKKSCVVM